jgi:mannose/cellobiose epimerase-like protein (N-acyl-D-glucosamine 2-epimerase family)/anti-anti-sigma regulatory factor
MEVFMIKNPNSTGFSFSDLVAGYVKNFDRNSDIYVVSTSDEREFSIKITATTYAELIRNLGEPFIDCTGQMRDMLKPGTFIYSYGIFFPEEGKPFEVKHIVFSGKSEHDWVFEKQDWWIKQIRQLGNFYLKAQFGESNNIDYSNYHTMLNLYGDQIKNTRQETDTISRLVYGFASAYNLTGDEAYLEAAEKGTEYLREHFRAYDPTEEITYWYHAVDFSENHGKKILGSNMVEIPGMRKTGGNSVRERKMLSSEFGDDYDAIPAYEQIYALAGPTQTYRLTGDPLIRKDIDHTLNLFNKYFRDYELGGYFSHIDPVTFDPKNEALGRNKAKKNWNSVGDHAPAYLINLVLATNEEEHKNMLIDTADTITNHFQDYENSPFVNEKFFEDWSHDQTWGWQQNRGVVGHNLKIAWNLMRMWSINKDEHYVDFAKKIAELMPLHGGDPQRGGWYDVVDRVLGDGETIHRYAWHDRKAWWQQEQGILAYLILYGILKDKEYLKQARESIAFYNAWFLDHDSGAVYFNVLANGLPYLLGTERNKGSHSMSGYHSFELCFLASVYTNLLITKQPMDFYFSPKPNGFKDNVLNVAPDLLPPGSIKIESVMINGENYSDFDAEKLTVQLPPFNERLKVKVTIIPTEGLDHFNISSDIMDNKGKLILGGELDARAIPHLRAEMQNVMQCTELSIDMTNLKILSPEGARAIIFAKQKMNIDEDVTITGATGQVREILNRDEFAEEITLL